MMELKYFLSEDRREVDLFDAIGDMPIVGQIVYIRDNRNPRHLGQPIKHEVIRVDLSINLDYKPLYEIEPLVKAILASGSEADAQEANKLLGGKVFKLNFVDKQVEFSKTHAQVILKKSH